MASASSSSGSWPNALRKNDVFISFRGEDTRNNFTSHLHAALNRASLEVFREDEKLEKGHEIVPSLTQAIKDSNISVIVLSEDYASSKWCLDELDQIMQYKKDEGQFVIPIFYKVEPTDVRNQTGAYKKAFKKHEFDYQHDPDRVNRWRTALSEAGKLSGWDCETSSDESILIQEIANDLSTKLERISNCQGTLKDVIGIDEMIEPIEELLEKSHKVGIWGMGGVGKTTMAKALFVKLCYRFDDCCFLENVRRETEKKGLKHVRDYLASELLGKDMQIDSSNALRNNRFVARRLGSKKILVVLDDVDNFEQLEDLQDNICNFLGEGSKVIITTRDMQLLRANDYRIHEAKGLSDGNSLRLFIRNAFQSDHAEDGYDQLIKGFVDYTQHNPLALKVLGLLVCSINKKAWDDLLTKLRGGSPNDEIQKVLRLSYDRLDYTEKQIFLDIACFFWGESEEVVKELLESFDLYPTIGMQTLKDKGLIVTINGKVDMHDLIQDMGRQIIREENIEKPGKRSRLWDLGDIHNVFENCEEEKDVEGIIALSAASDVTGSESISTQIRYFSWRGYPMKSLPSNFLAKHLLLLDLNLSWVVTLWEGVQDLMNLRRLKLQRCRNLTKLPDFSKACRLESADLSGCESLCCVHASLLSLHSLISLNVSGCHSLESLQSSHEIHLKSLKEINIKGCYNLKEFSVSSEEQTSLNLSLTKIEELSPSIGLCSKLRTLNLMWCRNLTELPDNITQLSSLEELYLVKCLGLTKLPDNMRDLSKLQVLTVEGCTALHSLPELPPSLRRLDATNCTSLETVSPSTIPSTPQNYGEKFFSFINCVKLDLGAIEEQVKLLLEKAVHEKEDVQVCYSGKKVPEWFGNNRSQNYSDTLKLCLSSHTLVGFVFCAIAHDLHIRDFYKGLVIAFGVEEDEMTEVVELPKLTYCSPGNVLLLSYPKASESILEKIEGNRRNHDATTYNPNLFFNFSFTDGFPPFPIEECGVCPIYASGYLELNSNYRKRKALMIS